MNSEDNRPIYITPTLPQKAYTDIANWKMKGKYYIAFICALMQADGVHCKNCVDADFVMVSFCRAGPFARVPNHKIGETMMWFDGSELAGKGWFIIKQTVSYDCPLCRPAGDRLASPAEVLKKADQEGFPWQSYVK